MNSKRRNIKVGDVYERLTIIEELKERKFGGRQFKCLCICGNTTNVYSGALGKTTNSCGCKQRDFVKNLGLVGNKKESGAVTLNAFERKYKIAAENRGYEWSLSQDEFRTLIKGNCHWCGEVAPLRNRYFDSEGLRTKEYFSKDSTNADRHWVNMNGIDRVNNSKGYTIENSVSCCKECNRMKMNMDRTLFLEKCFKIANLHNSKGLE